MIRNLKGRLDALRAEQAKAETEPKPEPRPEPAVEEGLCRYSARTWPMDTPVGGERVSLGLEPDASVLSVLLKTELPESFSIKDVLFMDTETTGLSTGAGTLAFLVGIGFYAEDGFVTEQYLLEDYDQETDLLKRLLERLTRFTCVATFNGKSYDVPLLETRFVMNRLRGTLGKKTQLDLLHAARRLYKRTLDSCRLGSVEENVLGLTREGDIPGAEIPEVFFTFLKDHDPTRIETVMKHNEQDVLTMPVLLGRMVRDLEGAAGESAATAYSRALIWRDAGHAERAEDAFRKAADAVPEARYDLSLLLKRQGRMDEAVSLWEAMARKAEFGTFPIHELAKYEEHTLHCPEKALERVSRVRSRLLEWGIRDADLDKRYSRLVRLCERSRS